MLSKSSCHLLIFSLLLVSCCFLKEKCPSLSRFWISYLVHYQLSPVFNRQSLQPCQEEYIKGAFMFSEVKIKWKLFRSWSIPHKLNQNSEISWVTLSYLAFKKNHAEVCSCIKGMYEISDPNFV